MREELDKKLTADFPNLFKDRHGDMRQTCMVWGFPGDGWYGIIREAAEKLEPLIRAIRMENPEEDFPRASQVKEKFGTMRFYMTMETEEMSKIIEEVERKSAETCEDCGNAGELRRDGWWITLCNPCKEKHDERNKSEV